jgi:hypothetical protein
MKKFIIVLMAMAFVVGVLTSCNNSVCPTYVMENKVDQVQYNS